MRVRQYAIDRSSNGKRKRLEQNPMRRGLGEGSKEEVIIFWGDTFTEETAAEKEAERRIHLQ